MALPDAADIRAGRLVVATLLIGDPSFERSVVLLLDHDEVGSIGVVLNRPTELAVTIALPDWGELADEPAVLFEGGPVQSGSVLALGRLAAGPVPVIGWAPLASGLGTVDLTLTPEALGGEVAALRLFSGYAGWGPGQLAGEIDGGAWWVFDAEPDDPFSADPRELWWRVVGRQGPEYRIYRQAPTDVSLN
jgi:putative transcriptional regulator